MGICKSKAKQTGNEASNITKKAANNVNKMAKNQLEKKTRQVSSKVENEVKTKTGDIVDKVETAQQINKIDNEVRDLGKTKVNLPIKADLSGKKESNKEVRLEPTNFNDLTDIKENSFRHKNNWLSKMNEEVMETMKGRVIE